jgi:hypothetical protein
MFTATPGYFPFLLDYELHRLKTTPMMRAIAKGLRLRATALTPPILSRFHLKNVRSMLRDDRLTFGH